MLLLACVFYALLALAALVWGLIVGRPNLFVLPGGTTMLLIGVGAAAGIGLGLLVVGASRLCERQGWAQELNRFFASVLGKISWTEATVLALASALGEELFFRGALQPSLGLWITTSIFAILHLPPKASLLSWTALAWLMGLAFGLGAELTGNLAAPMLAHVVINLLNLRNVARYAPDPANAPVDAGVQVESPAEHADEETDLAQAPPPDDESTR